MNSTDNEILKVGYIQKCQSSILSPIFDFCTNENLTAVISDVTVNTNEIIEEDKVMLISAYVLAPVKETDSISKYLKNGNITFHKIALSAAATAAAATTTAAAAAAAAAEIKIPKIKSNPKPHSKPKS